MKRQRHMEEAARLLQLALAKKKRIARFPRLKASLQVERAYKRKLRPILTKLDEIIERRLISRLQTITEQFYKFHPALSHGKRDADEDDSISRIINDIRIELGQDYSAEQIMAIAKALGLEIADFNELNIVEGIRRVAGVDVFLSEPWLVQQIETFATVNTDLITGLTDYALDQVKKEVLTGLMSGERWENIADSIRGLVDPDSSTTSSRADFIARDQVSKLNGQLTELRQSDLGIEKYIWRTSQDERVRDSHRSKEGNIYEWASPPPDTGHPGEDYNCRCTAEPYLEELLGSENGTSTAPTFFEDQTLNENEEPTDA